MLWNEMMQKSTRKKDAVDDVGQIDWCWMGGMKREELDRHWVVNTVSVSWSFMEEGEHGWPMDVKLLLNFGLSDTARMTASYKSSRRSSLKLSGHDRPLSNSSNELGGDAPSSTWYPRTHASHSDNKITPEDHHYTNNEERERDWRFGWVSYTYVWYIGLLLSLPSFPGMNWWWSWDKRKCNKEQWMFVDFR